MRNSCIICLFVLLFVGRVGAQCPDASITFTTQNQVDQFPKNYPGCSDFMYGLNINGNISNLDSLIQLNTILDINILNTQNLLDLDGISNLKSINTVNIYNNKSLNDISAIAHVNQLNNLIIDANPKLKLVVGFDSILEIKGIQINNNSNLEYVKLGSRIFNLVSMSFANNPKLISISGLDSLRQVSQTLELVSLFTLQTITTFKQLESVNGNLILIDIGLTTLSCFKNLKEVGNLQITHNKQLLHLNDLNSLKICANVTITANLYLNSITGFKPLKIKELTIDFNPALVKIQCFDSLLSIGTLIINNNTVLNEILFTGNPLKIDVLKIYQQPNLVKFNSFNLLEVNKELNFQNNEKLEEVKCLSKLKGLQKIAYFDNNPNLRLLSFDSLDYSFTPITLTVSNHASVVRIYFPKKSKIKFTGITLRVNPELVEFVVSDLLSIDYIVLIDNLKLSLIEGFSNLQTISGVLNITSNHGLQNLSFLNQLNSVGEISIVNNNSLENCKGLDNLTNAISLLIKENDNATSIFSEDCNSKSVRDFISIINNDLIQELDLRKCIKRFFILNVQENASLLNIKIGEVISAVPIEVMITDNLNLKEIEFDFVQKMNKLSIINNSTLSKIGNYKMLYSILDLKIELNSMLVDLSGLDTLKYVVDLSIVQNDKLKSLKGMKRLEFVTGNLIVYNNEILEELFVNIEKSIKNVNITNNSALMDINSLRNCTNFDKLAIVNNPNLSDCSIQSVCAALSAQTVVFIYNNNTDCNSNTEVALKCNEKESRVYPNPANQILSVFSVPFQNAAHITIYDMQGRLVHYFNTMQPNIDIRGLTNGVYFIEVETDKIKFKQKFVKY